MMFMIRGLLLWSSAGDGTQKFDVGIDGDFFALLNGFLADFPDFAHFGIIGLCDGADIAVMAFPMIQAVVSRHHVDAVFGC